MMENGLNKDAALRALTLQPARLLGIDQYCGSVEAGKMANLLVSNKPIFEKDAAIKYMIVEGNLYAYELKEKKKPTGKEDHASSDALEGTWSYTIEIPDQKQDGTLEFFQVHGEWEGTIISNEITTGNTTLKDIVVDGHKVSFTYLLDMDGDEMKLEFDLILEGDSLEGSVSVGEEGSVPLTAARKSKPN